MAIKALGEYDFPSASRQELYGDDMLVNVWWKNNPMFCSAGCFRAPKAIKWADFRSEILGPWASSDPDYDPSVNWEWELEGQPFTPDDNKTLEEMGVGHKHTITMVGWSKKSLIG